MTLPSRNISLMPKNISIKEGSAVASILTAFQTVIRFGNVKRTESAVVIGASGRTGHFVIQFCKMFGVKTECLGSINSHDKMKLLGADNVLDYKDENLEKKILELFPGGVDNLIDLYGGKLIKELESVVTVGGKVVTIVEIMGYELKEKNKEFVAVVSVPIQEDIQEIKKLVESGSIQIEISKEYRFEDVKLAFSDVKSRMVKGKVALLICDE